MNIESIQRDVVVVGAGVTGLVTARELRKSGLSVVVLEARDRVGGRTWTSDIDGVRLEIGGQWISPEQTAILGLVDELGLSTFPRYRDGASVYVADGVGHRYHGHDWPIDAATNAEINRLVELVEKLVVDVDPHRPWTHPDAAELDSVSLRGWLTARSDDPVAIRSVELFLAGGMLTKPSHAVSMLQAAHMAAAMGGLDNLVDDHITLDRRVVGGMQSVSVALAAQLGADVRLNCPVQQVEWTADGATVRGAGVEVTARRVVIALAPPLYSRISFAPALPRINHQVHQHSSMGNVIKVHAVYDTPFWRTEGLAGTVIAPDELVQEVYDNCNPDDPRGILVGFVPGEKAEAAWALPADERKAVILESIARGLGDRARTPEVFYLSDWGAEEWTRGAYAASFDLGGLHRYGRYLGEPVGPLRWASSDLAGVGFQHVDGAVRIGTATAAGLAAELT